jgi:Fe-S-cluster containining protein
MSNSLDDNVGSAARRLRFPEEEEKLPWLPMLLDAYAVIDEGVAVAITAEERESGLKLACREGCDNCCRSQTDIPLYPLELVGITWFVTERMTGPGRTTLRDQLRRHVEGDPCPFLLSGSCGIHPVRPVACRQFNVFYEPCEKGEDPYFTRRDEVLTPIQEYTDRAFSLMLPFYGVPERADKERAVKHIIRTQVLNLMSFDWKHLAEIMDKFDAVKSGS